ncbi:MAG TPA: TAT-variant-translocated molybdopterin oxidoreductase, partial [Burkholderiales bacterium]|nr:TAT-variant-translocated molybdopterin oxidoreductase [Burkholderiales bacterium]
MTSKPVAYWRSLEELGANSELEQSLRHEFPRFSAAFDLNRREFVKLMAASLALTGAGGCSRPAEKIVPYVYGPPQLAAGAPLFFATAITRHGYATGVLVESNMGRPTKIEGNPAHPASLGATDIFAQASVLELWDPDRSQTVMKGTDVETWQRFVAALTGRLQMLTVKRGAGLHILTETITSPTLAAQLRQLIAKYPLAQWHQYEPVNRDNVYEGARLAFGEALETRYSFDRARVVLSLDADFLGAFPGQLRYARDFAAGRRVDIGQSLTRDRATMNRLYVVESTPGLTGAMADHRVPARAGDIGAFALALAQKLGASPASFTSTLSAAQEQWLDAAAQDLADARGASAVVAGDEQPPHVHALAHAMNEVLGNVGTTVLRTQTVAADSASQLASLNELARAMAAGVVDTLVIAGNPVYHAPVDFGFAESLRRVALAVHMGPYHDETAALCHWHIPAAHELEAWGDARAFDGTVTLQQPLIAPLYNGKSLHELFAVLAGDPNRTSYDIVRGFWRSQPGGGDFELLWQTALHDGLIQGSAFAEKRVSLRAGAMALPPRPVAAPTSLEVIFRADPTIDDGRYANNAWLQELPKPLTKLTWSNAVLMSPGLARRTGCVNSDVVELRLSGNR